VTAPSRPRRPAPPPRGVVPAAPRLAARAQAERTERRRRRTRRLGLSLAVLVPTAALLWLVLLSPVLAVSDVQVAGTGRLAPEQVSAAAAIEPGTPLARIDVGGVAARVRAELPPVADVRVRRVWPDTLRLQVTERVPAAGVAREDGVLLVDTAGVGFATEPALPPGVPSLELATPGPDDPATTAALAVLGELPEHLRGQLAVLRAGGPSDVSFDLVDGRRVVWGAPGDAATKTTALGTLLQMEGELYDVSSPGIAVRR
jgi:cell division protein FtsQ